jgi:hypothetical protein
MLLEPVSFICALIVIKITLILGSTVLLWSNEVFFEHFTYNKVEMCCAQNNPQMCIWEKETLSIECDILSCFYAKIYLTKTFLKKKAIPVRHNLLTPATWTFNIRMSVLAHEMTVTSYQLPVFQQQHCNGFYVLVKGMWKK